MAEQRRNRPFVVGLTGSIGMGKSETLKLFERLGVPVYDADATVHILYDRGGTAVAAVAEAFPDAVRDGRIDRAKLAEIVVGNKSQFQRLEAIVHPLVAEAKDEFIRRAGEAGEALIVLDIPLLFETGGEKRVDAVVVASAPEAIQRQRVMARAGMTSELFEAIHARQIPDAEKRAKADFVIETGEGIEHAFEQVRRVATALQERAAARKKD